MPVPGPPGMPVAVFDPVSTAIVATWTPPVDDGGFPILGYELQGQGPAINEPSIASWPMWGQSPTIPQGGIANAPIGMPIRFRVRARNAIGFGPWSQLGTPAIRPGRPLPGLGGVLVSWGDIEGQGGLALTADSPEMFMGVSAFSGWFGSAQVEVGDETRALADGMWLGPKNMTAREMVLEGWVQATRPVLQAIRDYLALRAGARQPGVLEVTDLTTGQGRRALVRATGALEVTMYGRDAFSYAVPLRATDPRIYGMELKTATVAAGGPAAIVVNAGTVAAPVALRVRGQLSAGATISFTGTGVQPSVSQIRIAALNANEAIVIDSETLQVFWDDSFGAPVNRFVLPGSRPIMLVPTYPITRQGTVLYFTPSAGSGSLTAEWRDAWL